MQTITGSSGVTTYFVYPVSENLGYEPIESIVTITDGDVAFEYLTLIQEARPDDRRIFWGEDKIVQVFLGNLEIKNIFIGEIKIK